MKSSIVAPLGIILVCLSVLALQAINLESSQVIPRDLINAAKIMYPWNYIVALIGIIVGLYFANKFETSISRLFAVVGGLIIIVSGGMSIIDLYQTKLLFALMQLIFIGFGIVLFDFGARLKIAVGPVNMMKKIR